MHDCTCCPHCQQELSLLTRRNQELLLDLPPLRERAVMARQTMQLYKEENGRLNQARVELQARVQQLEQERQGGTEGGGREGRRIDQMVRVVNCKNGEIVALKQEIGWKNYEMQNLRKRLEEIDRENAASRDRVRILEDMARLANERSKTLEDTSQSYRQETYTPNKVHSSPAPQITVRPPSPSPHPRLQLINSKIEQLQHQNWRLRQHLITKI